MSERLNNFDLFAEQFKTAQTVYFDFTTDTFSIYLGTKTGAEMFADHKNWLETNSPSYLLTNKFGIETPWSASCVVVAAALGKNVIITNFGRANLNFWQSFQTQAEVLAAELEQTAGRISFEPKADQDLNEEEQQEAKFLNHFEQKPTLYYDPGYAQFWIYLGPGEPTTSASLPENWTTITDQRLQEILGYVAGGYIDHLTIMLASGYNIELLLNEENNIDETIREVFELLKSANQHFDPIQELTGKLSYFIRKNKTTDTE